MATTARTPRGDDDDVNSSYGKKFKLSFCFMPCAHGKGAQSYNILRCCVAAKVQVLIAFMK